MRYLLLILVSLTGFWACKPEEACISSATNRLVLDFYRQTATGPVRDTLIVGQVKSTASESVFFDNNTDRFSRIFLRVDPDKDTTTFVFERTALPARKDTLVVAYQRRYRLISPECPLEVSFQDLQVVRSTFRNAQVINTELREPSNDTDVQVFY